MYITRTRNPVCISSTALDTYRAQHSVLQRFLCTRHCITNQLAVLHGRCSPSAVPGCSAPSPTRMRSWRWRACCWTGTAWRRRRPRLQKASTACDVHPAAVAACLRPSAASAFCLRYVHYGSTVLILKSSQLPWIFLWRGCCRVHSMSIVQHCTTLCTVAGRRMLHFVTMLHTVCNRFFSTLQRAAGGTALPAGQGSASVQPACRQRSSGAGAAATSGADAAAASAADSARRVRRASACGAAGAAARLAGTSGNQQCHDMAALQNVDKSHFRFLRCATLHIFIRLTFS